MFPRLVYRDISVSKNGFLGQCAQFVVGDTTATEAGRSSINLCQVILYIMWKEKRFTWTQDSRSRT